MQQVEYKQRTSSLQQATATREREKYNHKTEHGVQPQTQCTRCLRMWSQSKDLPRSILTSGLPITSVSEFRLASILSSWEIGNSCVRESDQIQLHRCQSMQSRKCRACISRERRQAFAPCASTFTTLMCPSCDASYAILHRSRPLLQNPMHVIIMYACFIIIPALSKDNHISMTWASRLQTC